MSKLRDAVTLTADRGLSPALKVNGWIGVD